MSDLYQDDVHDVAFDGLQSVPGDYINAVCDLVNLCQMDNQAIASGEYVSQVNRVRGHINEMLVSNGLDTE